jgi:diguanylate cyclase
MSTILILDDNAINRKLLAELLTSEGHQIIEASDGAEGLLKARLHKPQLVISDILMPEMDGYEFVRLLRADAELARTAVIFHTANYHQREALALATQCHVDRVIIKPCAPADFLRAVESVLRRGPSEAPLVPDATFDTDHLRLLTNRLSSTAEDLQASNDRMAALIALNGQLASARDRHTLLTQMCNGARSLFGARFGLLVVADRLDSARIFTATSGLELPRDSPSLQLNSGALGSLLRDRRSMRIADRKRSAAFLGLPSGYPLAQAIVAAAIATPERVYGWICLADKVGASEFNAEDEQLLSILGAQVGRVYENTSLQLELRRRADELTTEMNERERSVHELLASEERFRDLAETVQDAFFLTDPSVSAILYVSPAYERITGHPCQELLDDPRSWERSLHPDDLEQALAQQRALAANLPRPGNMEFRIVRPDGAVRWIHVRVFATCDPEGVVLRVAGVASDVTERHLVESRVRQLSRVHAMLSGINSVIVRADNRAELLKEICRLAIDTGNFGAAWCGLLYGDSEIRTASLAGALPPLLTELRPRFTPMASPENAILRALSTRQPVVRNDLEGSSEELSVALIAIGYRAMVALPVIIAGTPVGCIVLVTRDPGFFDADEMDLLGELVGDLAFALDHISKAEQLNHLAYYDVLTGLANRTLFLDRLTQLVTVAHHSSTQFAVIFADVERFSALNDSLGRAAGDQLLREIALRFARTVGAADLVGRVGSNQFAAVVAGLVDPAHAPAIVDQLWRDWLGVPFGTEQQQIRITAKAGIALFPADGGDAESLLRNAETALKTAKTSGRAFAAYTIGLSEALMARAAIERNLRQALENREFVLHYQPKVDMVTRRPRGLEALIRWNSPAIGLVPPAQFISVIEENGLIVDVGAWVLRQASLDRARWRELSLEAPRVAVNVSSVQLRRDDFLSMLTAIVTSAGSDPGLDLEVTESVLIADVAENLAKLRAIGALGLKVSLDDFGTGFSSLSYLAKLPVHQLKIDRSFVSTMLDDSGAMSLVSTIISLAHSLKLETVAEGVESEEQAKILRLLQCDQMQGYLVCRPLPFEDMTAYLRQHAPMPVS